MYTIRPAIRFSTTNESCTNDCVIVVKNNQFNSNSKYLLIGGSLDVEYIGEQKFSIDSPYNSSEWVNYIDTWSYGKTVKLSSNTLVQFVEVSITTLDTSNTPVPFIVQVCKINNQSITKSANSESFIQVVGNSFMLDGQNLTNQKIIRIEEARDINISSTGSCKVLYIEKA